MNTEKIRTDFNMRIDKLISALHNSEDSVLNDKLECVQKGGFRWRFLCLLRPFYALVGGDVYSHVRANSVAQSVLKYCEKNKHFLTSDSVLKINEKLIDHLNIKTKNKYSQSLETKKKSIGSLLSSPNNPQNPQGPTDSPNQPNSLPETNPQANSESPVQVIPKRAPRVKPQIKDYVPKPTKESDLPTPTFPVYSPPGPIVDPTMPFKWRWPADLKEIGLTEEKKEAIDTIIREVSLAIHSKPEMVLVIDRERNGKGKIIKKMWKLYKTLPNKKHELVKTYHLPIVLIPLSNGKSDIQIYAITKTILGKGAQTTVRLGYNLMTGEYLARKKVIQIFDSLLIDKIMFEKIQGINLVYGKESTSKGEKKLIYYHERLCSGMLNDLFNTSILANYKNKLSFINDLLNGLTFLHAQTYTATFNDTDKSTNKVTRKEVEFPGFHMDLVPENILVRKNPESLSWEAYISDFGVYSSITAVTYRNGYSTVERIKMLEKQFWSGMHTNFYSNTVDLINYNLKYAQLDDVWNLGLIFTIILSGRITTKIKVENGKFLPMAPLPSIERCIADPFASSIYPDNKIITIKQAHLDQDFQDLEKEILNGDNSDKEKATLKRLLFMVKSMLLVDPEQRISAQEALDMYKDIMLAENA